MLKIYCPNNYIEERNYIYDVIFDEFLGIKYEIVYSEKVKQKTIINVNDSKIEISDFLFNYANEFWLKIDSMPLSPLEKFDPTFFFPEYIGESDLTIIYGEKIKGDFINIEKNIIKIGIDIFGSCFFMLTRYEEFVIKKRDKYDRFLFQNSIAYKEKFINRPIVNEYVEVLWSALKFIMPNLERKPRSFKVIPTHDVDKPFGMVYDSWKQIVRHFAGDLLIRKNLGKFLKRVKDVYDVNFYQQKVIKKRIDTFNFIFKTSEKYSLNNIFFFMNSKKSLLDGNYTVEEADVQKIIKSIIKNGHKVGLHPSFISYKDGQVILDETRLMNKVLGKMKLPFLVGARQHYLRWSNPETWQNYENAGIKFDSSLTYAEHIGFRCGTCYEYSVYNLLTKKTLQLKEKPLIIMDGTLFEYMNLNKKTALIKILELAERCKRYQGEFIILWHNTTLDDERERSFYCQMLDEICGEM